jgi:hypothetical protein
LTMSRLIQKYKYEIIGGVLSLLVLTLFILFEDRADVIQHQFPIAVASTLPFLVLQGMKEDREFKKKGDGEK